MANLTTSRRIIDGQFGVWACGEDGHDVTLLFSTDGGRTWEQGGWIPEPRAAAWLDMLESRLAHYAHPVIGHPQDITAPPGEVVAGRVV